MSDLAPIVGKICDSRRMMAAREIGRARKDGRRATWKLLVNALSLTPEECEAVLIEMVMTMDTLQWRAARRCARGHGRFFIEEFNRSLDRLNCAKRELRPKPKQQNMEALCG